MNFVAAYRSCGISGNKPLIGANIVAVGLKMNKLEGLEPYVYDLMQMSRKYSELNSEFAKYPLVICYNYFREFGDIQGQKEVMYLLRRGKEFRGPLDYLVALPLVSEFILRKARYYPSNIFNWDIDFETIQQKSK